MGLGVKVLLLEEPQLENGIVWEEKVDEIYFFLPHCASRV